MPARERRSSTRCCASSRASSAARRVNAGVVLFCRPLRFLGARTQLDEALLAALVARLRPRRGARACCRRWSASRPASPAGGPIAALPPSERFHWLVAPASTIVQPSPGPHRADRRPGRRARPAVRARSCSAEPQVSGFRCVGVRWDDQARRRRPAGASAAPVILDVVRRLRGLIVVAGIVVLGCGGSGDRATARTPDRTPTAATKSSASNAVVAKPGLRLQKIGNFSSPVYVTSPPRRSPPHLRRRAGRHDPDRQGRQEAGAAVPGHREPHQHRRRARPAVDGVRPGLRQERAVLRLLHGQERRHPHRRVPPQERQPREPGVGPQAAVRHAHGGQPQRRPAAVRAGQAPVRRPRRRRRRRGPARHARQRPGPAHGARQDHPHQPSGGPTAPDTAARSTRTGCATRGATRSRRPAT